MTEPTPFDSRDFARATGASPQALQELAQFRDAILEGNKRTNLVGPSFEQDFWRRHALDSAQLFHVEHQALKWADVGAGAGFPGVVLAILLKDKPGAEVHLIDSLGKRIGFLRVLCDALDLPVIIHHERAERLHRTPRVDVVTARACAPLARLLGYTQAFFKLGAYGLFLKGKGVEGELTEARRSWAFSSELRTSESDPSGYIVRIEGLASHG